MLYVFYVNAGEMLTFSMDLIMANVEKLQHEIESRCGIGRDYQVLLVSGGECMDASRSVGSYKSAGTETSPAFLFSKQCPEVAVASLHKDSSDLSELTVRVENARADLPSTRDTMVMRVRLAQQLHGLARDSVAQVQRLIHSQHLQHQGWTAAIANMDDLVSDFQKHCSVFDQAYSKFMEGKALYEETLNGIHSSVNMLSRTTFLPCFRQQLDASAVVSQNSNQLKDQALIDEHPSPKTLLEWIALHDRQTTILELANRASADMDKLCSGVLERLSCDADRLLGRLSKDVKDLREIKGLGSRLSSLEGLLLRAQKHEEEQRQIAQSIAHNMTRCRDMSEDLAAGVLPELCTTHREQLRQMWHSTVELRDIVQKCTASKHELCSNLRVRLSSVIFLQQLVGATDGQLTMRHQCLQQLRHKLDVLQEVHNAPRVYVTLCAEAYRRRLFSKSFEQWAETISADAKSAYEKEVNYRRTLRERLGHHFLRSLFPKLHQQPQPFATVPPRIHDSDIPNVTDNDITQLCADLPEFVTILRIQHEETVMPAKTYSHKTLAAALVAPEDHYDSCSSTTTERLKGSEHADGYVLPAAAKTATMSVPSSYSVSPAPASYYVSIPRSVPTSSSSLRCPDSFQEKLSADDICNVHSLSPSHTAEEYLSQAPKVEPDDETATELLAATQRMDSAAKENNEPQTDLAGQPRKLDSDQTTRCAACQTDATWQEVEDALTAKPGAEIDAAVTKALSEAQQKHESEINDILQRFEEEHLSRVNVMKTSMVADTQVSFNEAVFRLAAEKDRIIEQLQTELSELRGQTSFAALTAQAEGASKGDSSLLRDRATSSSSLPDGQQLMAAAPTKSSLRPLLLQDKVAILTCNIGDLVILCYDKHHGQYTVFTTQSMLHFLHSDSLEALHLKPDGMGAAQNAWVVAEVVDKERCEAKKPNNRFHVPVGTRFFRVKAKPWLPEGTVVKTGRSNSNCQL